VIKEEAFQAMIDVNLKSVFFLSQALISYFLSRPCGTIVNVASVSGKVGSSSSPHYAVTKAGIIALTKSLARKFGPNNIKVNVVAPSLIETEMTSKLSEEHLKKLIGSIPLQRLGKPEEVASVILFLSTNASDYISGQTVVVDGGITMV
jgi:3-oxoacyl-[acyl-carrier protein] reductase